MDGNGISRPVALDPWGSQGCHNPVASRGRQRPKASQAERTEAAVPQQALVVAEPLGDVGLDPGPEVALPRWEVGPGSSDKQKVLVGRLGMAGTREEENSVREMRGRVAQSQVSWKGKEPVSGALGQRTGAGVGWQAGSKVDCVSCWAWGRVWRWGLGEAEGRHGNISAS